MTTIQGLFHEGLIDKLQISIVNWLKGQMAAFYDDGLESWYLATKKSAFCKKGILKLVPCYEKCLL